MIDLWYPGKKAKEPQQRLDELYGMQAGLLLRAAVYSPDGEELLSEVIQPGHSFVVAWPTGLNYNLSNKSITAPVIVDTTGNSRTLSNVVTLLELGSGAAAADATLGIVVGTGNNAIAMTDTQLQTQIAEGSGAGQLNHAVQTYGSVVQAAGAGPRYINIVRLLQNNSGGSITMNEMALYGQLVDNTASMRNFCFCRDLLTATVNAGNLLICQYQFMFNLT